MSTFFFKVVCHGTLFNKVFFTYENEACHLDELIGVDSIASQIMGLLHLCVT